MVPGDEAAYRARYRVREGGGLPEPIPAPRIESRAVISPSTPYSEPRRRAGRRQPAPLLVGEALPPARPEHVGDPVQLRLRERDGGLAVAALADPDAGQGAEPGGDPGAGR